MGKSTKFILFLSQLNYVIFFFFLESDAMPIQRTNFTLEFNIRSAVSHRPEVLILRSLSESADMYFFFLFTGSEPHISFYLFFIVFFFPVGSRFLKSFNPVLLPYIKDIHILSFFFFFLFLQ